MEAAPIVEELRARRFEELDYTMEAESQELFRRRYEGHPNIVVPRVFTEHSSRRVLTTELVEGAIGFYEFSEKGSAEGKRPAILTIYAFAFDSIYNHYVFNGDAPRELPVPPGRPGRVPRLRLRQTLPGAVRRGAPRAEPPLPDRRSRGIPRQDDRYAVLLPTVVDKVLATGSGSTCTTTTSRSRATSRS